MRILSAISGSATATPTPLCSFFSSTEKEKRGERKEKVSLKLKDSKLLKSLATPLMASILAFSPLCFPPDIFVFFQYHVVVEIIKESVGEMSAEIQRGATLFSRSCIGCHDAGGRNLIYGGPAKKRSRHRRRNIQNYLFWEGKNAWIR
ncbi:cytochrome c6, chloroplastic isoform X3 [Euphorbia lathyris]|uniref:cytochrome c6, chloroplastic isoform X3 n=1 Tax=Euphorbia lathyris TaxID=212925 RepID=UPI003314254A